MKSVPPALLLRVSLVSDSCQDQWKRSQVTVGSAEQIPFLKEASEILTEVCFCLSDFLFLFLLFQNLRSEQSEVKVKYRGMRQLDREKYLIDDRRVYFPFH